MPHSAALPAMADKFADRGNEGNEDDADDHQREVVLYHRDVAE